MQTLLLLCAVVGVALAQGPDVAVNTGGGGRSSSRGRGRTSSGTCSANSNDYRYASADFLNCLNDKMLDNFSHIKKSRESNHPNKCSDSKWCKQEMGRLNSEYSRLPCSDIKRVSLNEDIKQYMRDVGIHKDIANMVPEIQELLWTSAESEGFQRCILSRIRDDILQYLAKCTHSKIAFGDDLKELNVLGRGYNLDSAQQTLEMYIKFFLGTGICLDKNRGSRSTIKSILKEATKREAKDTCNCLKKRTDALSLCRKVVSGQCGKVEGCIKTLIRHPEKVFSESGIKVIALQCYNDFGKGQAGKLLGLKDVGERLKTKIQNFKRAHPGDDSFGRIIQGVAEAVFSTDFCSDCRLN